MGDPPGDPGAERRQAQGYDGHRDAVDLDAGAVGQQPAERPDAKSVARGSVCAGVSEEPAHDSEGEAEQQRGRGGRDPAEGRDEHQRRPVSGVGAAAATAGPRSIRGAARSWSGPSSPGRGARFRLPRRFGVVVGAGIPWWRYEGARPVRRLLQGRPYPPAAADVLPHRRPPVLARGGPRRLRRRVAPLAQGLPSRGPRGLGPRSEPAVRRSAGTPPSCGTARRASTRRSRRP